MLETKTLALGAFLGGTAVVFGALGSHALFDETSAPERVAAWDIAVRYQAWHALALLAVSPLGPRYGGSALRLAFALGVLLFSGSLYLIAIERLPGGLGILTPIGGLVLIVGWSVLLVRALQPLRREPLQRGPLDSTSERREP